MRVRLYVLTVAGVAAMTWIWTVQTSGTPSWGQAAFFCVVATLANLVGRVEVPLGGLTLVEEDKPRGIPLAPGFIVLVTAAYATRPSTAVAVASLAVAAELLVAERRHPLKLIFNRAQEVVYVGAASLAYWGIRGLISGVSGAFVAAATAALLAVVLNHLLVGLVVALDRRVAMSEVVRRMAWPAPLSLGFGLIALLIATLYVELGALSALFLFMPLTALRVVREAKMSLDAAIQRTVTDFARAVDEKDPYTYRHSDRVAMITVELHRELGTRTKDLERRWSGAVLHDVGKVAVPVGILTKPGALTDSEYESIKSHPGLGAEVVQDIDLFKDLAPEIRHHHERLDGFGYPDGLVGEEIPFAARVLAVADAFDALTSDRPYRPALSTHEALIELSRSAGTQHDPRVLEALRTILYRGFTYVRADQPREGTTGERKLKVVRSA
jgi:putative nucleotidyltransferase with HDIG domain